LTSHQVEVLAGSRKVKSKRMKSPHCSVIYNSTMWTVDIDDFQALNQGTSWERGCRTRKWWYIGLMGLLWTVVNVYIVMKGRLAPSVYRHKLNRNLQTELFHIARKQNPMHDLSAASVVEEYDYTILWPCAPVSFHNPLPQVERGVQGEEQNWGHILRSYQRGASWSQGLLQLSQTAEIYTWSSEKRFQ
jgi:hypothetical protein